METVKIGVIGDFDRSNPTHLATDVAVEHSCAALGYALELEWLPTDEVHELGRFDGFLCSPGSPYRSLTGALEALRFARERGIPAIGTCGGFQHMILEFARNVVGVEDAAHAEYDPYASKLFLSRLPCSLVGKTVEVRFEDGSHSARAHKATFADENYYCNFGLNSDYERELVDAGLHVMGRDAEGEARVIELPRHPFYVGTLYVPQARSTEQNPHPLVSAFVKAALSSRVATAAR
jgi:CTP synthase (UTP-ammonia lyase)